MTSTVPAYNSDWATEAALDVQWAHATAPLARIILIAAPNASTNSLLAAVNLANAMGPGVVSMSFGVAEATWTASVDSAFSNANMTYVASSGDNGSGVE
jgi:subtilase family serine protease